MSYRSTPMQCRDERRVEEFLAPCACAQRPMSHSRAGATSSGPHTSDRASAGTQRVLLHKPLLWPALFLALCWPAASLAGDRSAEGKAILTRHCARCHSIEAVGDSPLETAPPMRDIYRRYATRELQEELLEGKVSRHKEMPQISFSQEDVAAILSYLYDIARGK